MNERISTLEVRRRLGDILNRVYLRHERFVIERKGTALAAVVPVETLESLERLSRKFMLAVLARGRGSVAEAEAKAIADEAKHRSPQTTVAGIPRPHRRQRRRQRMARKRRARRAANLRARKPSSPGLRARSGPG